MTRAVVVIDGEHYPPVVRDAIANLPYDVVGAWLAGGTEKLRGGEEYGVPLIADLDDAFAAAEVVVDLSDEPVLGPAQRFLLASRALAAGLRYEGADFHFEPPQYAAFPLPSLAVIGTGKRVGKTAVTGHVARLLARDRDVVVVAMGRGGPAEPVVADVRPTLDSLLELSRAGGHAASDYLETAALTGVVTIGCRRAGGGLAGAVTTSNVLEGAALAAERDPDIVVFDGSGAAIPPIDVDARILVAGAGQDPTAYLNAYRVLVSDLVVLVGGGDAERVRELKDVPVVRADLRLRPVVPLEGRRVAVFTTGPAPTEHLDAEIVAVSRNLSDRAKLREDLARADADVFVVEIKAAAIDVVAEAARERGAEVVFAENEVVPLDAEPDLDDAIQQLVRAGARA
jgi:cyclic 2,3-diphosphoglycerate synthetase